MIESNLLPVESYCSECQCWGAPRELQPVTMWYRNKARETMYRSQPEPTFRFDLICSTVMFISIALMQLLVFKKFVAINLYHEKFIIFSLTTAMWFCSDRWVQQVYRLDYSSI